MHARSASGWRSGRLGHRRRVIARGQRAQAAPSLHPSSCSRACWRGSRCGTGCGMPVSANAGGRERRVGDSAVRCLQQGAIALAGRAALSECACFSATTECLYIYLQPLPHTRAKVWRPWGSPQASAPHHAARSARTHTGRLTEGHTSISSPGESAKGAPSVTSSASTSLEARSTSARVFWSTLARQRSACRGRAPRCSRTCAVRRTA